MRRILITGGAGFIGSHLCDYYIGKGDIVYCLDDFSAGDIGNIRQLLDSTSFKLISGSVLDKDLLNTLVPKVDVIIHLAAQIHVDRSYIEPSLTWRVNVEGTQNLLELARFNDIDRFLFASSSEIYGSAQDGIMAESHPLDAPHPYGASKIAGDRMCFAYAKTYHMPIRIIRCFNIYGPRQRALNYGGVIAKFVRRVLGSMPPIIYGKGHQTRDYMYISDAVSAYDLMLRRKTLNGKSIDGIPFNFGTGEEVSILSLAKTIIKSCGVGVNGMVPVHDAPRQAEVERLIADISNAKKFRWKPKVDLATGLGKYVAWYKKYGYEPRTTYYEPRPADVVQRIQRLW